MEYQSKISRQNFEPIVVLIVNGREMAILKGFTYYRKYTGKHKITMSSLIKNYNRSYRVAIANNVISEEEEQNHSSPFSSKIKCLLLKKKYKKNQQLPEKRQMILYVQPLYF